MSEQTESLPQGNPEPNMSQALALHNPRGLQNCDILHSPLESNCPGNSDLNKDERLACELFFSALYLLGRRWWEIEIDSFINSLHEARTSSRTAEPAQSPANRDDVESSGDDSEEDEFKGTGNNTDKPNSGDAQHPRYKKGKGKLKKKSRRGHGKRGKRKCNQEVDDKDTSPGSPSVGNTGSVSPSSRVASEGSPDYHGANPSDGGEIPDPMLPCAGCKTESPDLKTCTRCKLARYCGKQCQMKDYKRHKPTCLRIFAFNSAHKTCGPFLELRKAFHKMTRLDSPRVSFFLDSIVQYSALQIRTPVLVEILKAGLATDCLHWILSVRDVANNTTTVEIATKEDRLPLERQENQMLAALLRPGSFILLLNPDWSIWGLKGQCAITLTEMDQFHVVPGVNLSKCKRQQ